MGLLVLCMLGGCGRNGGDSTSATPAANIAGGKDLPSKAGNAPLKNSDVDPLHPVVVLETSLGNITITLDHEKSPRTVDNFLGYVNELHYDQTIVHQVFRGQGVVGGGYDVNFGEKRTRAPIRNEAENGLKNVRGTIAMARLPDNVHSATCQFFFNVADTPSLDFREPTPDGYGYCVFGEVTEGIDVVDRIANTPVHDTPAFEQTPNEAVVIHSARQIR